MERIRKLPMWLVVPIGTTAIIEALKHFLQCTESDLEKMGRSGRKIFLEEYGNKYD